MNVMVKIMAILSGEFPTMDMIFFLDDEYGKFKEKGNILWGEAGYFKCIDAHLIIQYIL